MSRLGADSARAKPGANGSDSWFTRPQKKLYWPLRVFSLLLMGLAVFTFLFPLRMFSFVLTSIAFVTLSLCDPEIMKQPESAKERMEQIRLLSLSLLSFILLIWIACLLCSNFDSWATHIWIPVGILVMATAFAGMRILSWRVSRFSHTTWKRQASDFLANWAAFMVCYTATLQLGSWYSRTGIGFAILNLLRVGVYRVHLRFFKQERTSHQSEPARAFFGGCLDLIPRAYLYTAFSFTVFQVVIEQHYAGAFERIHPSASLFLDFFYFNIVTMSTVGYGDIVPNTVGAKLLCSAEILFTMFILVAVAGILIQSVMDAKNSEGTPGDKSA